MPAEKRRTAHSNVDLRNVDFKPKFRSSTLFGVYSIVSTYEVFLIEFVQFRRKYGSSEDFGQFFYLLYINNINVAATWQTNDEWRAIVQILRKSRAKIPQVHLSDGHFEILRYQFCLIY